MVKITLSIDGMMCPKCESHMNDAIRKAFKVKKVTSSSDAKQTVIIAPSDLDREKLEQTVSAAGYKLLSITTTPYRRTLFSFGAM